MFLIAATSRQPIVSFDWLPGPDGGQRLLALVRVEQPPPPQFLGAGSTRSPSSPPSIGSATAGSGSGSVAGVRPVSGSAEQQGAQCRVELLSFCERVALACSPSGGHVLVSADETLAHFACPAERLECAFATAYTLHSDSYKSTEDCRLTLTFSIALAARR